MRQPLTVLVFPFHVTDDAPEYAVFRRADDANWQPISGGAEDDEDPATAARRETAEETGLSGEAPMYKLDMVSGVQKDCFAASAHWPKELYVVPKHFFAMDVGAKASISLSAEHSEFRWVGYERAYETLRYDDDRTALWELNARLSARDLPPMLR